MRLIDADALIKDLSYLYTKNHIPVDMRAKETLSTIMEQPTAYDVDKVLVEQLEKDKFNHTHADRIRNMSDEELAELITGSLNFDCADYCDSFTQGCAFNCGKKDREIALKWLQSEAE